MCDIRYKVVYFLYIMYVVAYVYCAQVTVYEKYNKKKATQCLGVNNLAYSHIQRWEIAPVWAGSYRVFSNSYRITYKTRNKIIIQKQMMISYGYDGFSQIYICNKMIYDYLILICAFFVKEIINNTFLWH